MAIHSPETLWDSGTTTSNNYTLYKTATLPKLSDISGSVTTDALASRAIDVTSFNGKKIMVGIEIVGVFDDVSATVTVQLSADGTNWTNAFATVTLDSTPNVSGAKLGFVDFTKTEVPFFRIVANASELDWQGTTSVGTLKFIYVLPPSS